MVALTKERVQKMKEAELRKGVLLPLLEAMGYQHVYEHHGSRELGKDFICWKNDDIGSRKNLALVVKAVPLTGQAKKAAGSTTEVQTQIQECFGKGYLDPVTGEVQIVHECWVVSNQEISTAAMDALTAALKPSGVTRDVKYIDGDRLWKLIEKYLPVRAIFQKLGEVSQVLDNLDTHSSLQVHLTNSGIQVSAIEIQSTDGESITLESVYLKITQIGLNEMTFVSDEKLTPLPLNMTLRMPAPHTKETARITFSLGLEKANPYQLVQLLQMQLCLSKAFVVALTELKTGIVLCQLSHATGVMEAPDLQDMEFIRDLAAIQVKTGTLLMLPEQGFTREDDEALIRLRTILHENGRVEKTWSNCYPYFPLELAKTIYEEVKDGKIHERVILREETETFLGLRLPMGLVETKLHRAKLINEREVYEQIQHAETPQTPILFKFEPADSNDASSTYLKWKADTE